MQTRFSLVPIVVCLAGGWLLAVESRPPAVLKMERVNADLERRQTELAQGKTAGKKAAFEFSEAELNEYLAWSLRENPRPGIDSMKLKFFPKNYISSYSVIDFDEVEKWRPGTIPTLLKPVLNGKRGILVDIRFQAANQKATYKVEKAYFDKVPIPALVVEKVISVVASRQPEKYDTSRPVPLPLGVDSAWTGEHSIAGQSR